MLEKDSVQDLAARQLEFVEDDGKPAGETPLHGEQIAYLVGALKYLLRDEPDAYVGSNTFFYYDEDDWRRSICPDVYVGYGLGRPLVELRVFKCWEERSSPRLIVEVSSRRTFEEDLYRKKGIYQDVLGAEEYLIFDPEGDVVPERLRAYRLTDGAYREVGPGPFASRVVPASFQILEGRLRLVDRRGRVLPASCVEGQELGLQQAVCQILRARFGELRDVDEQRLRAAQGEEALEQLLSRALTVASPGELFGPAQD